MKEDKMGGAFGTHGVNVTRIQNF